MAIELLEHALTEAAKLPEDGQRALADWILLELQSERRRRETFATSQRELGRLAEEAHAESHAESHAGETRPLEFAGCKPPGDLMADAKNEDLTLCPGGKSCIPKGRRRHGLGGAGSTGASSQSGF